MTRPPGAIIGAMSPPRRHTRVLHISGPEDIAAAVSEAAAVLRAGGLVAFPTETVYGLGANALDDAAVASIFAAKERAADDPLIVHITGLAALGDVASACPPLALRLAAHFWPGPLTLVLPRSPRVAAAVSAGLETVAVRVPSHPLARAILEAAGLPIAAPSANRFTRASATTAAHVLEDLDGRIDLVIDGGPAEAGIESTVVAIDGPNRVVLLRAGAITREQLAAALGPGVEITAAGPREKRSPGMMAKHYAPRTRLVYIAGSADSARARLFAEAAGAIQRDQRVALLISAEDAAALAPGHGYTVETLGPEDDPQAIAHQLFAALRTIDHAGADVIFARSPAPSGLGAAIHDRLSRAATEAIVL